MKFNVIIEKDEEGRFIAECPDLPGCITEGDSLDEAIENLNEAIVGCLKSRLKTVTKSVKLKDINKKINISLDLSSVSGAGYA
jgi:Uncharacterized conserved protein